MDIGSAKITPEEMQGVTHYMIDELEPDEEFHVVRFVTMAKEYLKEIYADGKIPIIAGAPDFTFRHFCMILILQSSSVMRLTAGS